MHQFDASHGPVTVSCTGGSLTVEEQSANSVVLRVEGVGPVTIRFTRRNDERHAGLGEQFVSLDQTGRRFDATIRDLVAADPQDTYFYVPVVYSSSGYAVLVETTQRVLWDLGAEDPTHWSVSLPAARGKVRLFRGDPRTCVQAVTAIIGRPRLPPPWVFGVWKTTLSGTEAVLRHAERLTDQAIPVTACWIYDHYDEDTNSGCGLSGTFPSGTYPDLRRLTTGLHDLGYRALGYVQPCLYRGSGPFEEARKRGYLVRQPDGGPALIPYFNPKLHPGELAMPPDGGAYVDLSNQDAARWYRGLLEATADQGWDGWMQDMGEHLPDDAVLADGTRGWLDRNRYPLRYHQVAAAAWGDRTDAAVFVRSGGANVVPHVAAVWPGDQHCDWSADRGLRSVLPAGPSAGLCGVSAWGPDIGGILDGADGGAGGRDEELWLRWCQYGALNPIMRDHGGFKSGAGTPVDLWTSAATRASFQSYARLHLRLFPYFYGLAREASETGVPIIRAMLLEHPAHPEAWTVDDQYLLGDALLVAPVHEPGARMRRMWFPPGEWVSWWDGTRLEGPAWSDVPAPLEQIPLYQRAGTSIPLLPEPTSRLDEVDELDVEHRRV